MKVSDILRQKITEIQSRIPISMNRKSHDSKSFESIMKTEKVNYNPVREIIDANLSNIIDANKKNISIALSAQEVMNRINLTVKNTSSKYGMDENLIKAIIKQESGYDPYSVSSSGAQGLMQLMPGTAEILGVKDPFDIEQNIDGGVRFFKDMLSIFQSTELALAAYNAGPGNVKKYNGIPPFEETKGYVKAVLKYYDEYNSGE